MATRQAINNSRTTTPTSVPAITRIQVEGNDTVSFLYGTTPPYQYVRGMSQIMDQNPAYISYRYDTITISQVAGESFTFTIYAITDVGGNAFNALTSQDSSDVVLAKTQEIYRLLVTSVFKGCCECGNAEPECSIQYTAGNGVDAGTFLYDTGGNIRVNYFTANNQDFTGFWPIIQDGSWIFVFSKTDPTVYGVYQVSNYSDGGPGVYAQFDAALLNGPGEFPEGTTLCVDVTSVGGSLVQDWQSTLDISSVLDKDNTVDGAGFNFVFDNNDSFTINSGGGSIATNATGSSLDAGSQQVLVTSGYIDIITPLFATAGTGWVLAKTATGHVEYVEAGTGTVTSVALDMPPAFTVTGSPIEDSGTFTVTVDGLVTEYINGLGELATLPIYTVANGLHTQESPASDFVFHLGGQLIEDTLIETTNGLTQYQLSVRGSVNQDSQFPFGVANLGSGGVATFQDYGSGARPNPSVEVVGDVDLFQPLLELRMEGNLPAGGILADRTSLLRLKYDGDPSLARTSIDYQFKNDDVPPNNVYFIGGRLTTEVTNFTANAEESNFELQLFSAGSRGNKLVMEGKGQLELTNYATNIFWNGDTNINNSLTYVLGVDGTGKVWKTSAGTGSVTSVGVSAGTGISASVTNPTTTPVISITNTAPDQVVTLTEGANVTITGTYPNFTIAADGGGGTGTVEQVDTEGLITGGPITTTGTITTSVNENRLVGRWDAAGTGIMQEITLGTNLELTDAGVLNATGGPGTTYDSNQGVYKDTSLTNDTFMLGAPASNINAVDFQETRYIVTGPFSLEVIGPGNTITSGILNVNGGDYAIQGSGNLRGVTGLATGGSFGSFGGWFEGFNCVYATSYDPGGNGYNVVLAGGANMNGSELYNGTALTFSDADAASLYKAARFSRNDYSSLGPQQNFGLKIDIDYSLAASGSVATASSLVSKLYQTGSSTAKTQFEIQGLINGNASLTPQFTILGGGTSGPAGAWTLSPGQIKFNQYAAGAIYKSSTDLSSNSGYGLGVDSNGNIWATDLGGGGGGTYTVDNGLTEDPANNFQLGGALVADTDIDGSSIHKLNFINLNESVNTARYVFSFATNHAANNTLLSLDSLGNVSRFSHEDSTSGDISAIELTGTELRVQTPLYTTKTAGDVLTLVDPATGESEWSTPTGGGIPFGTATAATPDVYTATIGTATSYVDGDAYLVRFTVGNTDAATLNINGIGARDLYRNNDGPLIGGDIWDGGEMLCIYNAANNGFDCIGTSPNSLFAYVTNAQGSTISKGQAVYAAGGTGSRMTVKLALGDSDATSAQTIGFVFSTSIADNQKGIIIIQGYFTNLALFPPSASWADGDTVYLSPTVPGGVTRTKPVAPQHLVYLGVVASTSPGSAGRMYVRVQNGYEMNELHDVASNGAVNNDILYRDTTVTPNLWKPASIPTILGYTPANAAADLTQISVSTSNAREDNYTPTGWPGTTDRVKVVRIDSTNTNYITSLGGLANPSAGRIVTIYNASTANNLIIIENLSTSSTAANRFRMTENLPYFLLPNRSVTFIYDGTYWTQMSASKAGGFDFFDDATGAGSSATANASAGMLGVGSSGTGAGVLASPLNADEAFGEYGMSTGSTTTGYTSLSTMTRRTGGNNSFGAYAATSTIPYLVVGKVGLGTLATVAQDYRYFFGMNGAGALLAPPIGMGYLWSYTGNAATSWDVRSQNTGGTTSTVTTALPVTANTYVWLGVYKPGGANTRDAVYFYSTNGVVYTVASKFVGTVGTYGGQPAAVMGSIAGTTAKAAYMDWMGTSFNLAR